MNANTADATILVKVELAIQAAKDAQDKNNAETAAWLTDGGWMTPERLNRILGLQATMWVYDRMESVLEHCRDREEYTLPGTVARLRRELQRMLVQQSTGTSTDALANEQERAKIHALQHALTMGPLATF